MAEAAEKPAAEKPTAAEIAANVESVTVKIVSPDGVETTSVPPPPPRPAFLAEDGSIRMTYVLIGGGTASYSAMKAILSKDKNAQILIISDEDATPYARPPLSKELWVQDASMAQTLQYKDWSGQERSLFYEKDSYYTTLESTGTSGVVLLRGRRATKLNVEDQYIVLDNGQKVHYKKVLLATGGTPRQLPLVKSLPVETRERISTYRSVADFERLSAIARSSKSIVVIGGGFLGSELSYALAEHGRASNLNVSQIFPEEGNMGLVFPRYLSTWTSNKMRAEGVNLYSKTTVTSLAPKEDDPTKVVVTMADGRVVEADHVVVAVGIEPNVQLARGAGLELDEKRGGILVNAELESRSNVFAVRTSVLDSVIDVNHGFIGWRCDVVPRYRPRPPPRRALRPRRPHRPCRRREHGRRPPPLQAPVDVLVRPRLICRVLLTGCPCRSDLGPKIGYEAVGILDSRLQTVGVWAKATAADTPQAASAAAGNIRNMQQNPNQMQVRAPFCVFTVVLTRCCRSRTRRMPLPPPLCPRRPRPP